MSWLADNWFWVLFGVGFIAMHLFGHGGHGGHGSHGRGQRRGGEPQKKRKPNESDAAKRPGSNDAHRH